MPGFAAAHNPRKHRASSESHYVLHIRERFERAVSKVGEGMTQAMHYRGPSEGRGFC